MARLQSEMALMSVIAKIIPPCFILSPSEALLGFKRDAQ